MKAKVSPTWIYLRRATAFLVNQRSSALILLGLMLGIAGINALEPLLLKYAFDSLGAAKPYGKLLTAVTVLISLGLLREALNAVSNWLTWRTRLRVQEQLLDEMVGRLHRLPLSFYKTGSVGAIMTKFDRNIHGVVEAATQLGLQALPSVAYLVMTLVIMFQLDWRLALLICVLAPLPPFIAARVAPTQIARERNLLSRWMRIYSRFNEVLSGIITVKSFTREEAEKERFMADVTAANKTVLTGVAFDARAQALQNLVVTMAKTGAIGLGCYLTLQGNITIGTTVAFLGYLNGVFAPVQGLSNIYRTVQTASVALEGVFSILDSPDTVCDGSDAIDIKELQGLIQFESVAFKYGQDCAPVLDDVNLTVNRGETVAIVGPSGGGKSTLMALLQRFYDPDHGRILIDGLDIRSIKQSSLRRNIAVVLQEPLLFNDSIIENIAYGRPNAPREEIIEAAKAANADEFIRALPADYDTKVGDRGGLLSAGQRQRISIARALLKDAPILVLDEAISALDADSEILVQNAVERLMDGRTTFVIAHRLSTVINADRVVVLVNGRITESGSHLELMHADGYYAKLVRQQAKGLLPDVPNQPESRTRQSTPTGVILEELPVG
jgi:ATP-binding cassette, subfamily B, bacterial